MVNSRHSRAISSLLLWLSAIVLASLAMPSNLDAAQEPEPQAQGLFTPASSRGPASQVEHPAATRSRQVQVDVEQVVASAALPQGGALTLNLFDGVTLTAIADQVERSAQGGITWTGHVQGQDDLLSQVILIVEEGVLAGFVATPEAQYQIRYAGGGIYTLLDIDQSAFPEELEPLPADLGQEPAVSAPQATTADTGSTVDLLVVYTPAARSAAGGTTGIRNEISLAVEQTNLSYVRSQVNQRLRLVQTAEVSYVEALDFPTNLSRLRDPADGYLDSVHSLRSAYRADEVALIVHYTTSPYCGIAYFMDTVGGFFESWAFAVIELNCATGYYTFGHELGHNMGARHDWYIDAGVTPYTYSHGYVNETGGWRTMMAYNDSCVAVGTTCTRLLNWSNPAVYYGGQPTGLPAGTSTLCATGVPYAHCDADSARTLNNTAYTVANFRQSLSAPAGLAATAVSSTQINLAWTDTSPDESGFRVERSPDGLSSWVQVASLGANVTAYADSGLAAGTTYYYRVQAFDAYVGSTYSNVAQATTLAGLSHLVFDGYQVDDDNVGDSQGNGDGIAACGETIELWVTLRNDGGAQADGVSVQLSSTDPDVNFLYNQSSGYGNIAAGATATNLDDFDLQVAPGLPWGHRVHFDLVATATNGGPWSDSFDLMTVCGQAPHALSLPLVTRSFVAGFDSQFDSSAPGWEPQSGTWWVDGSGSYTTEGLAAAWASSSYAAVYTGLDYRARLWRNGCSNCAAGLMVRGQPAPLGAGNAWQSGYGFYITRDGRYSVQRYNAGAAALLQGWTSSSYITPGSVWNTLRVVASGPSFWLYINGGLVWSGSDSAYASGRVGLGMYRDPTSTSNQLWADWATLDPVVVTLAGETVPAEQQALNDAAEGAEPAGTAGQAPGQIGGDLENRPPY